MYIHDATHSTHATHPTHPTHSTHSTHVTYIHTYIYMYMVHWFALQVTHPEELPELGAVVHWCCMSLRLHQSLYAAEREAHPAASFWPEVSLNHTVGIAVSLKGWAHPVGILTQHCSGSAGLPALGVAPAPKRGWRRGADETCLETNVAVSSTNAPGIVTPPMCMYVCNAYVCTDMFRPN
jgi:hypothetical protein